MSLTSCQTHHKNRQVTHGTEWLQNGVSRLLEKIYREKRQVNSIP